MRILFLSREYPPHGAYFGSAQFYQRLARNLSARGHEVHVVCQAIGRPSTRRDDGVLLHQVGRNAARGSPVARIDHSLHAWRKARELIARQGIEVVDAPVWPPDGLLYSLWPRGAPLVLQAHAWAQMHIDTKSYGSVLEWAQLKLLSYLDAVALRRADTVIANSGATYEHLLGVQRLPPNKVALIPEGIDTSLYRFVESDIRSRMGLPAEAPLVLFVGRLQARKGLQALFRAIPSVLRQVPTALFVLVGQDTSTAPGGGSLRSFLEATARAQGFAESVRFIDTFLTDEEVAAFYSACDLFVFPSLSETFGKPVLEAMACGKPVVATATGVASELEPFDSGLAVVPPGDAEALAKAVAKLLPRARPEAAEIARRNRATVEESFSFSRVVDAILAAYGRAAQGHPEGAPRAGGC